MVDFLLWCLFALVAIAPAASRELQTCVVASSNGASDDSKAIADAFTKCATDGKIVFQKGKEYNVYKPLSATKLSNVIISVEGNLNLPKSVSQVQDVVKAAGDSVTWFKIGGKDVQYIGSEDVGSTQERQMLGG